MPFLRFRLRSYVKDLSKPKRCNSVAVMVSIRFRFYVKRPFTLRHIMLWSSYFKSLVPCLKLLYVTSPQKQVTDVNLVLKDSDTESENLSSLIRLSVLDGQKADSSKVVSSIGI